MEKFCNDFILFHESRQEAEWWSGADLDWGICLPCFFIVSGLRGKAWWREQWGSDS